MFERTDAPQVPPPDCRFASHARSAHSASPAFRRLATTYTLNELCWSFGTIALAVAVYDRTGSALATTLLFLATTFLPAFVAPALTARLDQLPVRRALPGLYLVEAALFAALAALAGSAPLAGPSRPRARRRRRRHRRRAR